MDVTQFESRYPELSDVLGDEFWDTAQSDHVLKLAVERDREDALEYMSKLVEQTPWEQIRTSYTNDLHRRNKFDDFITEMWGYVAVDRWLCDNPAVADLPGTSGLPDFECEHVDVDATRIREAEEEYRVRRFLEDKFGDRSYIGILTLKPAFDKQASTGERWAENEEKVDGLIEKLDQIDPDNPETVETDALRVEFREKGSGSFGFMSRWARAERIVPDEEEKIARALRGKVDQARDGRPFVVFIDCRLKSIDDLEEVVWILVGEPYGFAFRRDVSVSSAVEGARSEWGRYLEEIGGVPTESDIAAIRPGDEGVFADDAFSGFAGVLIRLKSGKVGYVPNVYTEDVDAHGVFDRLGWGMDTVSLSPEDL